MRALGTAATTAALALVSAAPAAAQPSRFQLTTTLQRGGSVALTLGTLPRGELAFSLRASSDGTKAVRVTQRRVGGRAFVVLDTRDPRTRSACRGAAGTLGCDGITTPVTPGGRSWRITVRSDAARPTRVTLTITWRRVTSAG